MDRRVGRGACDGDVLRLRGRHGAFEGRAGFARNSTEMLPLGGGLMLMVEAHAIKGREEEKLSTRQSTVPRMLRKDSGVVALGGKQCR